MLQTWSQSEGSISLGLCGCGHLASKICMYVTDYPTHPHLADVTRFLTLSPAHQVRCPDMLQIKDISKGKMLQNLGQWPVGALREE